MSDFKHVKLLSDLCVLVELMNDKYQVPCPVCGLMISRVMFRHGSKTMQLGSECEGVQLLMNVEYSMKQAEKLLRAEGSGQ